MASKPDIIETTRQWGIKTISARAVDEIIAEAPKLGLTNGQLIEKLWEHWKAGGAPERVDLVGELVRLASTGPWGEHNPMPGEMRTLINTYARTARGAIQHAAAARPVLPGPQPGNTDDMEVTVDG